MLRKVAEGLKFGTAYIVSRLLILLPKYRDVWVITERRHECKDNGYYFFTYVRKNHPEIQAYYALDLDSPHINKIQNLGNVVVFNSWKHYVLALSATRLIGAFLPCGIPSSMCFYKFGDKLARGKKCFLQHGITMGEIPSLTYEKAGLDLFICGAKPEYDFVSTQLHYPKDNVSYTGLCRFDGLENVKTEKMILIMPTWRKWIPSATWSEGKNTVNVEEYEYFRRYNELISNQEIQNIAKEQGCQIVFYLHHEMQPYRDYFLEANREIVVATEEDYDVQMLLKTCACLITDFSSVAFDVAYMSKPVIYYQFDEQEYYTKHYQRGYFDYDTMGFGPKCKRLDEVVNALKSCAENGMMMTDEYKQRSEKFFSYCDTDNSKRVYEQILCLK